MDHDDAHVLARRLARKVFQSGRFTRVESLIAAFKAISLETCLDLDQTLSDELDALAAESEHDRVDRYKGGGTD